MSSLLLIYLLISLESHWFREKIDKTRYLESISLFQYPPQISTRSFQAVQYPPVYIHYPIHSFASMFCICIGSWFPKNFAGRGKGTRYACETPLDWCSFIYLNSPGSSLYGPMFSFTPRALLLVFPTQELHFCDGEENDHLLTNGRHSHKLF